MLLRLQIFILYKLILVWPMTKWSHWSVCLHCPTNLFLRFFFPLTLQFYIKYLLDYVHLDSYALYIWDYILLCCTSRNNGTKNMNPMEKSSDYQHLLTNCTSQNCERLFISWCLFGMFEFLIFTYSWRLFYTSSYIAILMDNLVILIKSFKILLSWFKMTTLLIIDAYFYSFLEDFYCISNVSCR